MALPDPATANDAAISLDLLLAPSITTDEAEDICERLDNAHQYVFSVIKNCVTRDKPDTVSLNAIRSDSLALHKILAIAATADPVLSIDDEPFHRREGASVRAARALASLGLALVDDPETAIEHLRVFRRWIKLSGLEVPGPPVRTVPATFDTKHAKVARHLAAIGELDLLSLVWMGELDGWLRDRPAVVRGGPSVGGLLDLGNSGQHVVLSLSRVPSLPGGLIPDPATMTLTSADDAFRTSLSAAWDAAGGSSRDTVLWSLTNHAGPVTRVTDQSLGLAFTVLLDEQRRLSRRVRGPLTVRRLQPRTMIVGRIDPDNTTAASSVSGYGRKFSELDASVKVVLPSEDLKAAVEALGERGAELVGAQTWKQAAKKGRDVHRRRLFAIATVCLLVVSVTAFGLFRASESGRAAEQRRAVAADLAAQSGTLRQSDPILAAKLGLAAYRIDSGNGRAVDALRNVLADHRNVVRTWQVDPSRVDALAVNEKLDRVLTSGSEQTTKLWKLSSGEYLGQLPKHTFLMATAQRQAIVAGRTAEGVTLYDIGGDRLAELGEVKTSCAPDEEAVALGFTHMDTTLVVVWNNGAISTHDLITRTQKTCLTWQDALTPITFPNRLPVKKVIAADVVGPDYADRPDEEVMLLLSDNSVVSVRTGSRDARIEVPSEQITGDAAAVAASKDTVSVTTPRGVAVWNRATGGWMANLTAGRGDQSKVLVESNGHLMVSGDAGTALIPLNNQSWAMAESLQHPSGGAATVAAIHERALVAGGPGGRVWVIADSAGELALSQRTLVTDIAFLPDNRLIAAEVPAGSDGKSIGTNSLGLVLIDPKAPPPKGDGTDPEPIRWVRGAITNRFYANSVAVSADHVASAGQVDARAVVQVWSRTGEEKWPKELTLPQPNEENLKPEERIFAQAKFTPDGRTLVARNITGQVGFWATDTWQLKGTLDLKTGNTRMFVQSGRAVFVEGRDDATELVVVDLTTLRPTRRVPAPNVVHMSTTPDASTVATMTSEGSVQILDRNLEPLGEPWRPSASGDPAWTMDVDPTGRRLAIGQGDQVSIYDLDAKTLAMPPIGADGNTVVHVEWSPDGELLAGSTMPPERGNKRANPLQIWKVGGLDWMNQVCRWAAGGLSRAEWQTHVSDVVPFIDICEGAGR